MNPRDEEVDIASPLNTTDANEGGENSTQPARSSKPAATVTNTPDTQPSRPTRVPPGPTRVPPGPTRVPGHAIRPAGPPKPPASRPGGPTRTPGPARGTPSPNPRLCTGASHRNCKPRRISVLRRYCVPITTVILLLTSLVVIAILIKVVLDNYYYFCIKSFKFIPLDKWCDGQADCAGNEDEMRCVQRVDFSNNSIVRISDSASILQILTSSGRWSYICFDGFDTARAKAVCAQLGYSSNPSFSSATTPELNGLFSNILLSDRGIEVIPITRTCTSGNVVSLRCSACGINHKKERIIGGSDSSIETWPWQVSLQYMGQHSCGGSILTPRIILSAAHCFQRAEQQVDRWRVQAGYSSLTYTFASQVDKIFIHTLYILDQKPYDIALLKLKTDLRFSDSVQPICLPGFDNNLKEGAPLSVTGWGYIVEGSATLASTLQQVSINLISSDVCNREYFGQIKDTMMCAGRLSGGADTCQGDSGGPLVFLGESSNWEQVGIVSWGDGCGRPGKVGVYTRVMSYLPWIYGAMKTEL